VPPTGAWWRGRRPAETRMVEGCRAAEPYVVEHCPAVTRMAERRTTDRRMVERPPSHAWWRAAVPLSHAWMRIVLP
jgi:hypothetical protein